jgi:hypothetical protein
MPKYIIERDVPGAGRLTPDALRAISQRSCAVIDRLGPRLQWVQSYVTDDKLYCVYIASGEDAIREHARQGGFPANRIAKVGTIIDPVTSEG